MPYLHVAKYCQMKPELCNYKQQRRRSKLRMFLFEAESAIARL